jgi:hypothetical protein
VNIFWITLLAMIIFIFLMAIGAIFSHIKLHGSCGGLNDATGDSCMFCKGEDQCRDLTKQQLAEQQEENIPEIKLKDYRPVNN